MFDSKLPYFQLLNDDPDPTRRVLIDAALDLLDELDWPYGHVTD